MRRFLKLLLLLLAVQSCVFTSFAEALHPVRPAQSDDIVVRFERYWCSDERMSYPYTRADIIRVSAYDSKGNLLWERYSDATRRDADDKMGGSIGIWGDYYYYADKFRLYKINLRDGSEKWTTRISHSTISYANFEEDGTLTLCCGYGFDGAVEYIVVDPDGRVIHNLLSASLPYFGFEPGSEKEYAYAFSILKPDWMKTVENITFVHYDSISGADYLPPDQNTVMIDWSLGDWFWIGSLYRSPDEIAASTAKNVEDILHFVSLSDGKFLCLEAEHPSIDKYGIPDSALAALERAVEVYAPKGYAYEK